MNHFWRWLTRHWPIRKGAGRIYRMAWARIGGLDHCRDDFGNYWLVDLENFIDCHLFLDGSFEKEPIVLLERLIRRAGCKTFIDVGANLGLYAVTLARRAELERILAFEPDPRNYTQLMANLFLNGLADRVAAHNLALGAEPGQSPLYISTERKAINWQKFNRGISSLAPRGEPGAKTVNVEVRRLDDVLDLSGQKIAIKIDVEGFELDALRGMRRLLTENDALIQIEIFPDNLDAVNAYLMDLGYRVDETIELEGGNYIYRKGKIA